MSHVEKGYFSLIEKESSPRASAKPGLLIGVLVIVSFVAGGVFTFLLCSLFNESSYLQSGDLQHIIQLSKSIDWSKINETMDGHRSREKREATPVSTTGTCGDSIKLVGNPPHNFLSITKSSDYQLISKWTKEENFPQAESVLEFLNKTYIKVKQSGIYLIYSQLTFMLKTKLTVAYEIGKSDGPVQSMKIQKGIKNEWDTLGYCSQDKTDKATRYKQCPLFITAALNKGDYIGIYLKKENVTIDFSPGKSFFGMSLLMTKQ